MSREPKFRAWDKDKFIYSFTSDNKARLGWFFSNTKGLSVQQYTGLKDRNGVEIYEGDILEAYGFLMYVVKWCDVYCQYTYSTITDQEGMYTLTVGEVRKDSAVIGNIYENPELLQS